MTTLAFKESILTATLERTAWILAVLVAVLAPLANGGLATWSMPAISFFGTLSLVLTLLTVALGRTPPAVSVVWLGCAIGLYTWIMLSTTWAGNPLEAQRWAGLWMGILGSAIGIHLWGQSKARHAWVLSGFIAGLVFSVTVAFLQRKGIFLPFLDTVYHDPQSPSFLITGPYYNPSHFAGYLLPISALLSTLILFCRFSWYTPVFMGLQGILLYLTLKTDGSSIPMVILAALMPILIWIWRKNRTIGIVLSLLGAALLSFGFYLIINPAGQAIFDHYRQILGLSNSAQAFLECRYNVFETAQKIWASHTWQGVGVGQFFWESDLYRVVAKGNPCPGTALSILNYAHNDYYQMGAELGRVGWLLFLGLQFSSIWRTPRSLAELSWLAAFVPLMITGLFDAHQTAIPGTMAVIYALSALKLPQPQQSQEPAQEPASEYQETQISEVKHEPNS
jgi:hypothetical protein